MSGSIFGKNFTVTTWGESHGIALGVVIDGCPSGVALCEEDIQEDMDRRRPGSHLYSTARKEKDKVKILSGVFEGYTTGTPISILVQNEDHHSADYSNIKDVFRPGHADYTYEEKYGIRDYRGGGRSSGRETLARVAAGAVAKKILSRLDIEIRGYTFSIGSVRIDRNQFDPAEIMRNKVCMPDAEAAKRAEALLQDCVQGEDSVGGMVECVVTGLPIGLGEPVFRKLDAMLGQAIFSIGAVKGVEFGSGFRAAKGYGSENNDSFCATDQGEITKLTNHAGGVLGGISDGSPLILRAAFKPTPSIGRTQSTVTKQRENVSVNIKGRHDPVIVPRAVVVVEAMTAITLLDLLMENMLSNVNHMVKFYQQ